MMGALIGSGFGGVLGTITAIRYRTFAILPASMIGSGFSMGCVMGISVVVRQGEM